MAGYPLLIVLLYSFQENKAQARGVGPTTQASIIAPGGLSTSTPSSTATVLLTSITSVTPSPGLSTSTPSSTATVLLTSMTPVTPSPGLSNSTPSSTATVLLTSMTSVTQSPGLNTSTPSSTATVLLTSVTSVTPSPGTSTSSSTATSLSTLVTSWKQTSDSGNNKTTAAVTSASASTSSVNLSEENTATEPRIMTILVAAAAVGVCVGVITLGMAIFCLRKRGRTTGVLRHPEDSELCATDHVYATVSEEPEYAEMDSLYSTVQPH
ncbi:uncharacterized protein KZ484_002384 isoform 2-T2 [Pholidichthys leucotaenia]